MEDCYRGPRVRTRSTCGRQLQRSRGVSGGGLGEGELVARPQIDSGVTRGTEHGARTALRPPQVQPCAEPRAYAQEFTGRVGGGDGRQQDQTAGRRLDERLDHGRGQGVGRVRVVDVPGRIVGAHQRVVEEVAAQHRLQRPRHPGRVPQPGGDQGMVQIPVRGVVLRAAQLQRAVCGPGQLRGVVRIDPVQRPHRVEVAQMAVVVRLPQPRPRPLGERTVLVHQVRREPVRERPPESRRRVPWGVLGGRRQGVVGRGDVHRGVDRAPARVGRAGSPGSTRAPRRRSRPGPPGSGSPRRTGPLRPERRSGQDPGRRTSPRRVRGVAGAASRRSAVHRWSG